MTFINASTPGATPGGKTEGERPKPEADPLTKKPEQRPVSGSMQGVPIPPPTPREQLLSQIRVVGEKDGGVSEKLEGETGTFDANSVLTADELTPQNAPTQTAPTDLPQKGTVKARIAQFSQPKQSADQSATRVGEKLATYAKTTFEGLQNQDGVTGEDMFKDAVREFARQVNEDPQGTLALLDVENSTLPPGLQKGVEGVRAGLNRELSVLQRAQSDGVEMNKMPSLNRAPGNLSLDALEDFGISKAGARTIAAAALVDQSALMSGLID